jgi:hypothetical protein
MWSQPSPRGNTARSVTQTYSAVDTSVGWAGIIFQKNLRFPLFQKIAIKELPGPGVSKASKSRQVSPKNRNIPGIILGGELPFFKQN